MPLKASEAPSSFSYTSSHIFSVLFADILIKVSLDQGLCHKTDYERVPYSNKVGDTVYTQLMRNVIDKVLSDSYSLGWGTQRRRLKNAFT